MNRAIPRSAMVCLSIALVSAPGLAWGLTEHPQAFRDAYFLEVHEKDLAGAIAGYERVLAAGDAPAAIVAEAKRRLANCREELRSADLAALMPADAMAYVELKDPGAHLERLVGLLGVHAAGVQAAGADATGVGAAGQGASAQTSMAEGYAVPGEPGLIIPRRIIISAALIEQVKGFRGVAAAVTDINFENEHPEGVLIVHPGEVDALRGAIETAVQFVRPAEPIRGFRTIEIPDGECRVTVAFTNRLVIAGTQRAAIEGVIGRLVEDGLPSLATTPAFVEQSARRGGALAFAFVNAQEGLKRFQRVANRDPDILQGLAIGQAFFDLAHLNSLAIAVGTAEDGLFAEFVMALAEGQTNIAYNLLRTPPMRGDALKVVPAGAAAAIALGINPDSSAEGAARIDQKTQTVQMVTGLDLGREIFANIREIAVFVMAPREGDAPRGARGIPDVALTTVVGDPAKSEALWNFLLSLPSRVQGDAAPAGVETQVAGVNVRAYPLPNGMQVYFARTGANILIGSSAEVMATSLATVHGGASLADDRAMSPGRERIGPETSIAAIVHAGRVAQLASTFADGEDAAIFGVLAEAAADTVATVTIDESSTRLSVSARLTNLPTVERVLDALARAGMFAEPTVEGTAGVGEPVASRGE